MLSLGLRSYEMELGFYDLFTSYEMEVETHVHEKIENQLRFSDLFTSYEMELETHGHVDIENQLGFHEHEIVY